MQGWLSVHRQQAKGGAAGLAGRVARTVVVSDALALFTGNWQEEAKRCWSAGNDGLIPGWIADMVPPGREYDPLTRTYVTTDKTSQPKEPRPWQRRRTEVRVASKVTNDAHDQREEDVSKAMDFFGKAGESPCPAGGIVVDIGCGLGYVAQRLAESEAFDLVFALDVDWRQLEAARIAAEDAGIGPDQGLLLLRADGQELPFCDNSLDFAWWGMGLHKVQDAGTALRSVARVLRPGGLLLATTIASPLPGRRPEDLQRKALEAGYAEAVVEQPRASELVLRAKRGD